MSQPHPNTAPLKQARQDCINRKGACAGCLHALETYQGRCLIKWTQLDVIEALGRPSEPIPDPLPFLYDLTCKECGDEFESAANTARYCTDCRVEINRRRSLAKRAAEREKRAQRAG